MSRHDGKVWVRKLRTHYSSHPWEVRARNHNGYDYYETFHSWADAMTYADRLSRTREVVLPRPNGAITVGGVHHFRAWSSTNLTTRKRGVVLDYNTPWDVGTIQLTNEEAEELAVTLLSRIERIGVKQ